MVTNTTITWKSKIQNKISNLRWNEVLLRAASYKHKLEKTVVLKTQRHKYMFMLATY